MKILVVYAHPNLKSFTKAVLDEFTKGLEEGGHTFEVVDLYAIKFDPCLKLEELTGEQTFQDVLEQQEKITRANALAFIYPVWWLSFPSILRGWIDRVLSYGFAYKVGNTTSGIEGLLKHEKALLINTTMFSKEYYEASGLQEAMDRIATANLKEYAGIKSVEIIYLYGPALVDDETLKRYLEKAHKLGKDF